ncbi:hypothetical protein G5B30_13195 [Sphingobacterium sp. SGG-5]|uniref:DUF6141 family protein n=1 Tax=Sphingobacterium sp. SGG-5 TaxID=2710881 RepID=UPI0013ED39D6|nr:DUF6141 family protein [Sphingobacterium sp. SGG-5]NGM62867.1 hypothetical protein [Sphingobacterium sp. SGG-5]
MDNETLFVERQRFKQWWIWLILLILNGFFLYGVFKQVVGGQQFGDKPMSDTELLIATGLTIILTLLFVSCRLVTQVKVDGIYVRFFPFHLKYKRYPWDILTKCYVRVYSPISEYGGWGLRFSFFGKGKAYNVSGNKGLQLEFTNGKKLLIGTNKSEELIKILHQIGQLKS